jgi:hypothetical protein
LLSLDPVHFMPFAQQTVLSYNGTTANDPVQWPHRPVGLTWAKCGDNDCLLVTSDSNGVVLALSYVGQE